jgi:hypothetical protein
LRETGTWETDHLRPRGPKFLEFYEEYFCNLLNMETPLILPLFRVDEYGMVFA